MANDTPQRMSKNERRQQAREQARLAREQEKKREKRNRLFLQGGVVLGVIAILAVVGIVLMQTMKPAGPGPSNMASGGVIFGEDLQVVEGPALEGDGERVAPDVDRSSLPLDVTIYVDYMCPGCGNFEQTYGSMLETYVGSGDVQLQVYPLTFQDSQSLGSKYSTRAANIVGCVVDQQPDYAFALHNALLMADVQPAQGTTGLSDEELLDQAAAAGANVDAELRSCVNDRSFADFFTQNTRVATEVGILGLEDGAQLMGSDGQPQPADEPQRLVSTPLVIVNGQQWDSARDGELEAYLLKVKSEIEQNGDDEADAGADASAEEAEEEPAE